VEILESLEKFRNLNAIPAKFFSATIDCSQYKRFSIRADNVRMLEVGST
jgi:hypothetical protein